jgi:hypothetical protein
VGEIYRLSFLLPATMMAPIGRHQPCQAGCVLHVERGGLVKIDGPSRDRVFEQARRFFRIHSKGLPPMSVAATLETPAVRPRRDSWSIIIGADIAFSPTAMPPDLGAPELERAG